MRVLILLIFLSASAFANNPDAIKTTVRAIGKTKPVKKVEKYIKKRYNLKHIGIIYVAVIRKKMNIRFKALDLDWKCEMEKNRVMIGINIGF